jgi:hypothetical protein
VSDVQWRTRPAGHAWSIGETAEHVASASGNVAERLARKLLASPFPAGVPRFDDAAIAPAMFDTDAPPPPLALPTGRFARPEEGVAALRAACDALAAFALRTTADLRAYGLPHPLFGPFDGVQWLLFAAAHTENHAPDLRALRAHPDFAAAAGAPR